MRLLWSLLLLFEWSNALRAKVSFSGCNYSIYTTEDQLLCTSSRVAFFVEETWHVQGQNLACVGGEPIKGGGAVLHWRTDKNVEISTRIEQTKKEYGLIFRIQYHTPIRLNYSPNSALNRRSEIISNFPAFKECNLNGRLSWSGTFMIPRDHCNTDGPCVMYDQSNPAHGPAMVLSPLDNFPMTKYKTKCFDGTECAWTAGLPQSTLSLPDKFSQSFVLYFTTKGVTTLMHAWGEFMQKVYKSRKKDDITVNTIGYQASTPLRHSICSE